jgi:hypothetical protein
MARRNLAARAARWSAQHRRKAIFGWLAFVLISAVVGLGLGTKEIPSEDLRVGESRQADQALADGFPDRARLMFLFVLSLAFVLLLATFRVGGRRVRTTCSSSAGCARHSTAA